MRLPDVNVLLYAFRAAPNAVAIAPGPRYWSLFERLRRGGGA